MYDLKSTFYPASEPKNGYIGKADITIANAVRVNNISVFAKDGGYAIKFADYGENNSYVVPKSKDAYSAMLGVVEKAVHAEGHFGYEKGEYGVKFVARGAKVDEKYADGRYSVEIGELCTLNGITTRWVEGEKDGKAYGFVSVDMPAVRDAEGKVHLYEKDGKNVASLEFQGLVSKWTDKEGKKVSLDYGVKLADAVKKVRKELYPEKYAEKKPSIDDNIAKAEEKGKAVISKKPVAKQKKTEHELSC